MLIDRVIIIVLDAVGVGEMPDSDDYGDSGADTLGNISRALSGINLPHLRELGLGNITEIQGVDPVIYPLASYGKMAESSKGKDTSIGHWEIAGVITQKSFPVYPNGFSNEIINEFENRIHTKIIGNKVASGTQIINELGQKHIETGYPIVYTSHDSVFQIACHEEIVPVDKLYEYSKIARSILTGDNCVSRIIARPFIGKENNFTRTDNRRDFSVIPKDTLLNNAVKSGYKVFAIGKISDIFAGSGISVSRVSANNMEGLKEIIETIKMPESGIIVANLQDTDTIYAHRNDIQGFYNSIKEFDEFLPRILNEMKAQDILFITADHGCDPTRNKTDHSREYVPLLVYGKNIKSGINLGIRRSFSDIARTISDALEIKGEVCGESFLKDILIK